MSPSPIAVANHRRHRTPPCGYHAHRLLDGGRSRRPRVNAAVTPCDKFIDADWDAARSTDL
jgi:hypothetical protein